MNSANNKYFIDHSLDFIRLANTFMAKLCSWIVCLLASRTEIIYVNDNPYLLRCHILNHFWIFPAVYLHYFYRGDEDRSLHNHPWKWAYSLILSGGYLEEKPHFYCPITGKMQRKKRRVSPWSINRITQDDFHRVSLTNLACWTLFIPGPYIQKWGFIDDYGNFEDFTKYADTGKRVPLIQSADIIKIRGKKATSFE